MRILYCVYEMGVGGGIERTTTAKANYLVEQGHEVYILTCLPMNAPPKYGLDPRVFIACLGEGLGYHYDFRESSIMRRGYRTIQRMRRHYTLMCQYLAQTKFDVVVTTHSYEMAFLPLIKDGSKKILELHSSKLIYRMQRVGRVDGLTKVLVKLFESRDALCSRAFDAVGCLTQEDRINRGCPSNMYVIPNPRPFAVTEISGCDSRIVLAIGRHFPEKNFIELVDIWGMVAKDFPDWRLKIVGDGYLKSALEEKIRVQGLEQYILLEEETADPRPYYQGASVFVLTSLFEGLPMTLLEAQAYGLPIVSYACPCGPRDVVTSDTGFLITPQDKQGFAQGLRSLMENAQLRKDMGQAAYRASKQYSIERVMSQWMSLFKS